MAKLNILTTLEVDAFAKKGEPTRLNDGGGLSLVRGRARCSWAFAYTSPTTGQRREMGLGILAAVRLADARGIAAELRVQVARGIDPLQARAVDKAASVTFREVAEETLAVLSKSWRNADAEVTRWNNGIELCHTILNTPVRDVSVTDIKGVLSPLDDRPTVKRYVLSIIRRTFDVAVAKELRAGNPATARVIGKVTSLKHKTKHNTKLPYNEVPAYVSELRGHESDAARCMELIIRTGVRKSEAREATFDEFDFTTAVWTIPAERTKKNREHTVPLTNKCVALILSQQLRHPGSAYVFPGSNSGRKPDQPRGAKPLSHGAFLHLLKNGTTVHGFRSSLRDYLGDETDVSFNTAEEVLGHAVGDMTVRSYRRSSGLAKRRAALTYWGDFIDGVINQNVKPTGQTQPTQGLHIVR